MLYALISPPMLCLWSSPVKSYWVARTELNPLSSGSFSCRPVYTEVRVFLGKFQLIDFRNINFECKISFDIKTVIEIRRPPYSFRNKRKIWTVHICYKVEVIVEKPLHMNFYCQPASKLINRVASIYYFKLLSLLSFSFRLRNNLDLLFPLSIA